MSMWHVHHVGSCVHINMSCLPGVCVCVCVCVCLVSVCGVVCGFVCVCVCVLWLVHKCVDSAET